MSQRFLVAALAALLSACAAPGPAPVASSADAPLQSPNDNKAYRYLVLDNQMKVLLISDPKTQKAAAALDVNVGSGDNPPGRGGLAHFLEHMLFLGTDKYPDPAEYAEYVSEHGGHRNAYTSMEHTNYFFDIDRRFLPESLDRFAQFFIAPRFDAQYVEREKNAVQAEYQMGIKSDGRRGLDVLQEVMNPAHPFSQFSVGSLETLADRPDASVRDDLLKFYRQYYSANIMSLAVLGAQSLDELEEWVVPLFSQVPNRRVELKDIAAPLFAKELLPALLQIEPEASQRQLQLFFPVADFRQAYHTKPLSYVSNLVGHEGEGSLLSLLKDEGWAESLSSGAGLSWRGGGGLSIDITLTREGLVKRQRVLQKVFDYLDMLRAEGPRQDLYAEQSELAALAFRFREESRPMGYVTGLASDMQVFSPQDVLRGNYMMDRYDPAMLAQLLGYLRRDNVLVTLMNKDVEVDVTSQYYGVPYSLRSLGAADLEQWRSAGGDERLRLPAPNRFIAGDVELVSVAAGNPPIPTVVRQGNRQKLWFRQDDEFKVPRGAIYTNFSSPLANRSPAQTASARLYVSLLVDAVNEYAYPALLAGLNFNLYNHARGISLRVSGYSDKQLTLLQQLVDSIAAGELDAARFDNIRADMIRGLENVKTSRPSRQVMGAARQALLYNEWGEEAMIAALQALSLDDVHRFAKNFWGSAQAEVLVYGNYTPATVDRVSDIIGTLLTPGAAVQLPPLKMVHLQQDAAYRLTVDIPHDDAVLIWYLQGPAPTWHDRAGAALTGQIMSSGFFQQLRTEQQLGYIVSAFAYPILDVPGIAMLVQSPSASAVTVEAAMEAFLQQLVAQDGISEEQFQRHRTTLLREIRQPDKNLRQRAEFYWQSIAKSRFAFDSREQLAAAVEVFDYAGWVAHFREVYLSGRHRSLLVVSPGQMGEVPQAQATALQDAAALRDLQPAYEIP